MKEKEEIIEFHIVNKDIWKDFVNEPKQNKSNCFLLNLEINGEFLYYGAEVWLSPQVAAEYGFALAPLEDTETEAPEGGLLTGGIDGMQAEAPDPVED